MDFPTSFPNKTAIKLSNAGLDFDRATRMSDEELLKLPGVGPSTVAVLREHAPHIVYAEVLTADLVRGHILVIDTDKNRWIDSTHLMALLAASRGFALRRRDQLGLIRRTSP